MLTETNGPIWILHNEAAKRGLRDQDQAAHQAEQDCRVHAQVSRSAKGRNGQCENSCSVCVCVSPDSRTNRLLGLPGPISRALWGVASVRDVASQSQCPRKPVKDLPEKCREFLLILFSSSSRRRLRLRDAPVPFKECPHRTEAALWGLSKFARRTHARANHSEPVEKQLLFVVVALLCCCVSLSGTKRPPQRTRTAPRGRPGLAS